jgi:structural maintenance of chromosomes protein 5
MDQGKLLRTKMDAAQKELAAFDTQEGQQFARLKNESQETAAAWEWIQANRDQFEKEVYGPPLISCSVKDPRYTDAIESLFKRNDYLTITAQTSADFQKLSDHLLGTMKLAAFGIRNSDGSGLNETPLLSAEEMRRLGFDGWALDFMDGPPAVLSMLVASNKLAKTAISLGDITDAQLEAITDAKVLNNFVAGTHSYSISRRKEYGPTAVSTQTKNVWPASHWIDQPVDTSGKIAIQSRIDSMKVEFQALKAQMEILKTKINDLESRIEELDLEVVSQYC